jgi:uncharacterized protein (DUF1330 family)
MTPLESVVTAPAYFVALVEVHDPAGFQSYHEQFEATLAPLRGRLVSFGAKIVPLEGMDGATARAAIVVFPSLQAGTVACAAPHRISINMHLAFALAAYRGEHKRYPGQPCRRPPGCQTGAPGRAARSGPAWRLA